MYPLSMIANENDVNNFNIIILRTYVEIKNTKI